MYIFLQVLMGIQAIHSSGLAHRDIKPENILIDPHTYTIKISDLGTAAFHVSPDDLPNEHCRFTHFERIGTPRYFSNEI